MSAICLPPELCPRTDARLRGRLRRSWRNLGKRAPRDLDRWPHDRLWAAWLELLKRQGFDVGTGDGR